MPLFQFNASNRNTGKVLWSTTFVLVVSIFVGALNFSGGWLSLSVNSDKRSGDFSVFWQSSSAHKIPERLESDGPGRRRREKREAIAPNEGKGNSFTNRRQDFDKKRPPADFGPAEGVGREGDGCQGSVWSSFGWKMWGQSSRSRATRSTMELHSQVRG